MKIKKINFWVIIWVIIVGHCDVYAQNNNDFLTKKQLQEEFQYLIDLVSETNPHIPIYQQLMNYDVIAEMNRFLPALDKVQDWADYYLFLSSVLQRIPEEHTNLLMGIDGNYANIYPNLVDSLTENSYAKLYFCVDTNRKMANFQETFSFAMANYAINSTLVAGKVYNLHEVIITDKQNRATTIPLGAEITKVNGIPITLFMKNRHYNYPFSWGKWDVKRKQFYHDNWSHSLINSDFLSGNVKRENLYITFIKKKNREQTVLFATENPEMQPFHNFTDSDYNKLKQKYNEIDFTVPVQKKVLYFDSILYIKVIEMKPNDLDFFKQEIAKYAEFPLKKIVIDVRNNGGGSDLVWIGILSAIIDTALCHHGKIAVTDCDIYRTNPTFLSQYTKTTPFDSLKTYYDPLLKKQYRLLSDNNTNCQNIIPDDNSLHFNGKICLLHNRKSFSSSIAFVAFALGEEQIVAVGENNGELCGYGVSPFVFQLPYSKLAFVMHASIHIPNTNNIEDYFWNKTEIEVETTPEFEELLYLSRDIFTPNFLKNHDPFFKKVLKLP